MFDFSTLKGKLIVSCQALPDEPLHGSFIMGKMARAAEEGGAGAIRSQGMADILAIKEACSLPVIGLVKRDYDDSDIYITPTKKEVDELLATGCDVISLDMTNRKRPHREEAMLRHPAAMAAAMLRHPAAEAEATAVAAMMAVLIN